MLTELSWYQENGTKLAPSVWLSQLNSTILGTTRVIFFIALYCYEWTGKKRAHAEEVIYPWNQGWKKIKLKLLVLGVFLS